MRPVSAAFSRAVRSSHGMAARARLVPPGQTGTEPDGDPTPIEAGNVKLEADAAVRSTLDLTTIGRFPTDASSPLAPYGQEVFIERGVRFGNGSVEWVSLGYFRLEDTTASTLGRGAVRLSASDRMAGIREAELVAPRQITGTRTLGSVVAELVTEVYPGAVIEWDDALELEALGRTVIVERDRYAFLAELWAAHGKVAYFDHRGVLVIASPPDVAAPVVELKAGAGGVLIELAGDLSRKDVANGVVATGEAPDGGPAAYGLAVDADPASPTYWGGPFGKVPRFFSSPLLLTDDQARAAAATMLRAELGIPYALELAAVPDPSLEPLDPVRIRYRDGGADREQTHVLTELEIGLTAADALEATTREQTHVRIGEHA